MYCSLCDDFLYTMVMLQLLITAGAMTNQKKNFTDSHKERINQLHVLQSHYLNLLTKPEEAADNGFTGCHQCIGIRMVIILIAKNIKLHARILNSSTSYIYTIVAVTVAPFAYMQLHTCSTTVQPNNILGQNR